MEHSVCYTFILLRLHMIIMLKNITEKRTSYTHTCTENTDICANRNSFKISHGSSFCFFSFDHPHFHFVRLFLRKKKRYTYMAFLQKSYIHTYITYHNNTNIVCYFYIWCLFVLFNSRMYDVYICFFYFFFFARSTMVRIYIIISQDGEIAFANSVKQQQQHKVLTDCPYKWVDSVQTAVSCCKNNECT